MSKRNLIIAAAVLVLLALVSQWFGRSGNEKQDEKIGNPLLVAKQIEAFDELVIQNLDGKITLQKKDDQWIIAEKQGYPANMEKLVELIDTLTGSTIATLVTKDEKRLGYFQLVYWGEQDANSQNSGTQLTLNKQNQKIFTMMAGKKRQSKSARPDAPASPGGVYVRIGESPSVYLIKENLNMEVDSTEWIQTSLFGLAKQEIRSVVFEVSGDRFVLERLEKGKKMGLAGIKKGQKTAEFEVSSVLSDLEDFKIDELLPKSEIQKRDLALKSIITVSMYDSSELIFRVYSKPNSQKGKSDEEEAKYYVGLAQVGENSAQNKWQSLYKLSESWMFEMEDWKAKRWIKSREDFIEKKDQ